MRQIDIISFVDAVANPSVHFKTLKDILPVFNREGRIVMYAGNQSVVFKVDIEGRFYALKCTEVSFDDISEGVKEAVMYIASQDRDYLVRSQYLESELSIYTLGGAFTDLSVELRPWIEGSTLGSTMMNLLYIGDSKGIDVVIDKFLNVADSLLAENFAHGDIKPDNILITTQGEIVLIDFGSVYINQYHSCPNKEIGTIGYRHPLRDKDYYNRRIDDYPIAIILSTMLVGCRSVKIFDRYNSGEFSIFDPIDVIEGRSEVYNLSVALFKGDIIESQILQMLKSSTPALEALSWWIKKIIELRAISPIQKGDRLIYDSLNLKYGLCDSDDRATFPAIFDDAILIFDGEFAVKIGSLWAIVDGYARQLSNFEYSDIKPLGDGIVAVMQRRKYALMQSDHTLITDYLYDDLHSFYSNYAVVKRDGKYGYIDIHGTEVVEIKYDFARNVRDGVALVRMDDSHINIDIGDL